MLRLAAGVLLAPCACAVIVFCLAYMVAGLDEPSPLGFAKDATRAYLSFVAVLGATVVPALVLAFSAAGWRSSVIWTCFGFLAGGTVAGIWAVSQDYDLNPAMTVGAVSTAIMMAVTRAVGGIRSPRR
ncbi:MAG: hypothetical protein AAF677_18490 [Pseudomonadota bacterium]